MRTARPTLRALGAASLLSLLVFALPPFGHAEPAEGPTETPAPAEEPVDSGKVIFTVNGKAVTQGDLDAYFNTRYGQQAGQLPADDKEAFKSHAMESVREELTRRTLLLQAADEEKVESSEADVDKQIAEIRQNVPEGVAFDDFLGNFGMTEKKLRVELGDEVRISKLIENHTTDVAKADDAAVLAFYDGNPESFAKPESVSARHILIGTDEGADEDARKAKRDEAEKVRADLVAKKGENFAELATTHSTCPSKAEGGSLGSFERGRMVPEFEKAAFAQKVGEVGEVVETEFGYHIIVVDEHAEPGKVPLEEVRDDIAAHLDGEAQNAAIQGFIESLEAKAKIVDAE